MKILVYPNLTKQRYFEKTTRIVDKLLAMPDVKCFDYSGKLAIEEYNGQDVDIIVSIGGDGTLLRAGKLALALDKPIAGINGGRLGYLCAYGYDEFLNEEADLAMLLETRRSVLEYKDYLAINEFMVTSKNYGSTIDLKLNFSDDEYQYRANGLIISTPTGSTGINVSAGGNVLKPECGNLSIMPICPCAYKKNGLIVSDVEELKVTSNRNGEQGDIYQDGILIEEFSGEAIFKKSDKQLRLLVKE